MLQKAPTRAAGRGRRTPTSWRRIVLGLAACVLGLLLAGCDISGTVDVRSGTELVADLTFTKSAVDCLGLTSFAGLTIKGIPDPDGDQLCRAQGTLDLEELKKFGIQVNELGDYLTVDIAMPQNIGYTPMQVDIRFPGPVTDPGATTASGNQVRLETGVGMATISPTRIVARSHPGPEWWVIAGGAAFVGGVLLTLAAVWVLRRRRRATLGDGVEDAASAGELPLSAPGQHETAAPPAAAPVAQEGTATADGPVRDPAYEALFAPPVPGAPAPPTPGQATPRAPAPEVPEADHSIWAPPPDQPDR